MSGRFIFKGGKIMLEWEWQYCNELHEIKTMKSIEMKHLTAVLHEIKVKVVHG